LDTLDEIDNCSKGLLRSEPLEFIYDMLAFTELARGGHTISIADFTSLPWVEIDTIEDLEHARQLFSP
jgi:choline kinase